MQGKRNDHNLNDEIMTNYNKSSPLRNLQSKKISNLKSFTKDNPSNTQNTQLNYIGTNIEQSTTIDKENNILQEDIQKAKESSFFSNQLRNNSYATLFNNSVNSNQKPKKSISIDKFEDPQNIIKIDHAVQKWDLKTKLNFEYIDTPKLRQIYGNFKELKQLNRANVI